MFAGAIVQWGIAIVLGGGVGGATGFLLSMLRRRLFDLGDRSSGPVAVCSSSLAIRGIHKKLTGAGRMKLSARSLGSGFTAAHCEAAS